MATEIDTNGVSINHPMINRFVNTFIEDANIRNIYGVEKHINKLDFIHIGEILRFNVMGITSVRNVNKPNMRAGIIIDESLLDNENTFVYVLYHELGHWFGMDHNHNHNNHNPIMNRHFDPTIVLSYR